MNVLQAAPPIQSAPSTAAPLVLQPMWQSALIPRLLTTGRFQIGAGAECEIQAAVAGVADRHALVLAGSHKVVLRAWDPRTWVNDTAVREVTLRAGDRVAIGPVMFRVRRATPDEILQQLPEAQACRPAPVVQPEPIEPPSFAEPATRAAEPRAAIAFDTTESIACSNAAHCGEWFSGVPVGPVFETVVKSPHWMPESVSSHSTQPLEKDADIEAFLPDRLRKERSALDLARQEWETERAEWQARIAQQDRDHSRRVGELESRARRIEEQEQQFAREKKEHLAECERLEQQRLEVQQQQAKLRDLRAQLLTERDCIEQFISAARADLAAEAERQDAACQEFEATQQRLTAELTRQLEEVDAQRAAASEQLAALDTERTDLAAERAALEADRSALQLQRGEFAAEQQSWAASCNSRDSQIAALEDDLQRQHAQLVADMRRRVESDAELLSAKRQLQQERRRFAEQNAAWLKEREALWDELSSRRRQLDADAAGIERQHRQLAELIAVLQCDIETLRAEREQLEEQQAESCSDAPETLDENQNTRIEDATAAIHAETAKLAAQWEQCEQERQELANLRARLDRDHEAFEAERVRWMQDRLSAEQELEEQRRKLEQQTRAVDAQHAALTELQNALEQEIAVTVLERDQLLSERARLQQQSSPGIVNTAPARIPASNIISAPTVLDSQTPTWDDALKPWEEWTKTASAENADTPESSDNQAVSTALITDSPEVRSEDPAILAGNAAEFTTDWSRPAFDLTPVVEPAELLSHDEPLASGGEKPIIDSVNTLRAELARLFNLPEDAANAQAAEPEPPLIPQAPTPTVAELVADIPSPETEYAIELPAMDPAAELIDWREKLQSLVGAPNLEPLIPELPDGLPVELSAISESASPEIPTQLPASPEPIHTEQEDSIAAYMERLLARTRKSEADRCVLPRRFDDAEPKRTSPIIARSSEPPRLSDDLPIDPVEALESVRLDDQSHLTEAPRHQQDKDAVRERIQSFRQVANLSARTALATHSWRKVRAEIIVYGLIASGAAATGAAFFYRPFWDGELHAPRGFGCFVVALWSLHRFLAAVFQLRKALRMDSRIAAMTLLEDHHQPKIDDLITGLTAESGLNPESPAEQDRAL